MSYRNDLEAARERRNALARELRTVERKMDELEALNRRKDELERELQKSAGDMDRARARVSLPLLSSVSVASPCNASWDSMKGDDRVRHCGQCAKDVFDLSAMAAEQAEALLREHGASLCVRFYRRRDGTVMTSDCPVGGRKRRKVKVAAAVLAGGLMTAGIGGFLSSYGAPEDHGQRTMGTPDISAEFSGSSSGQPGDDEHPWPVMGRLKPIPIFEYAGILDGAEVVDFEEAEGAERYEDLEETESRGGVMFVPSDGSEE